jgi:hypothetical protein
MGALQRGAEVLAGGLLIYASWHGYDNATDYIADKIDETDVILGRESSDSTWTNLGRFAVQDQFNLAVSSLDQLGVPLIDKSQASINAMETTMVADGVGFVFGYIGSTVGMATGIGLAWHGLFKRRNAADLSDKIVNPTYTRG